jgi:hypothetical protein
MTTTASIPRPRSLLFPRHAVLVHVFLVVMSLCVVLTCMSAWATHQAMREVDRMMMERGVVLPCAARVIGPAGGAIMMCDEKVCRPYP